MPGTLTQVSPLKQKPQKVSALSKAVDVFSIMSKMGDLYGQFKPATTDMSMDTRRVLAEQRLKQMMKRNFEPYGSLGFPAGKSPSGISTAG